MRPGEGWDRRGATCVCLAVFSPLPPHPHPGWREALALQEWKQLELLAP